MAMRLEMALRQREPRGSAFARSERHASVAHKRRVGRGARREGDGGSRMRQRRWRFSLVVILLWLLTKLPARPTPAVHHEAQIVAASRLPPLGDSPAITRVLPYKVSAPEDSHAVRLSLAGVLDEQRPNRRPVDSRL